MTPSPSASRRATLLGIGLMLLGVLLFSVNDTLGKWLMATYSVNQLLLIRSIAALAVLAVLLRKTDLRTLFRPARPGLQLVRAVLSTLEVGCFYWAVAYLPLADVMTYYMAGPIFVTVISALALGESVGWRRWTAILFGFAGVVVALRPTSASLALPALVALAGSFAFALLMIATRALRGTPDLALTAYQFAAALVFGLVTTPFAWVPPSAADVGLTALVGVVSMFGMVAVNRSLGLAPASVVVPYQYTMIVWAMVFGFVVFGDVPAPAMLVGAAIIVGAGLYIFFREQQLAKEAREETAPLI